ncbi:uncharacterized protein LOC135475187 isoform X2 [Liolophura sinensis]|uniref:uncharacterized protein LOC135475187 isoform X2 n=1 Tax=Liolophura sinensis TaxID=3198878 RepID=UPI0031584CFE
MIKTRAIKGGKLEKPRPLRSLHRAVSDPGTKQYAGEVEGTKIENEVKAEHEGSGNKDISLLENLVKNLENDAQSVMMGDILDLCQLLHDKGAQLEKLYPEIIQDCFSVIRVATKRDSVSNERRMLLLELMELRARGWQAVISEVQPQTSKVKEELNRSWRADSSVDSVELNSSFHIPVEIKWNPTGHMWQCEMILPGYKIEKVRLNTRYRSQVLKILGSSKLIISKDIVWNHRQVVLLGKKNELKKAVKYILEIINMKEYHTNGGGDHHTGESFCLSDLSDASDPSVSIHSIDKSDSKPTCSDSMNIVASDENSNALESPNRNIRDISLSKQMMDTSRKNSSVIIRETADEEVQTEPVGTTSSRSAVSKFDHQSLLQFTQGTLCLCANPVDKALLAEAKVVLQDHFCPEPKRADISQLTPGKSLTSGEIHLARSKSHEDSRHLHSVEQSYSDSLSHSKTGMGRYLRSLSTPERNSHGLSAGLSSSRNRSTDKGNDFSVFACYRNDSLDETQFTKELMDRLQLPAERGARVSSSTPDGTPEGSPAGSPINDISGKDSYNQLLAGEISNGSQTAKVSGAESMVPVTLLPSQLKSIIDGVVHGLTGYKVPTSLGDSLKNPVKTVRQPIIAGTSDLEDIEVTMPSGLYTPKGRRAMFKKYSDQVLRAQGNDVSEVTEGPESRPKIQYSWEELLACATSKHARCCPSDWTYLRHIFPDICLEQVPCYFDPMRYSKMMTSERTQLSYKPFLKPKRDLVQKAYLGEEKLENTVEEAVRDQ